MSGGEPGFRDLAVILDGSMWKDGRQGVDGRV